MISKENSAILGILLRNGSTRVPAGMISSVETSSPTLSRTGPSIVSDRGTNVGNEAMLGPFSIATCSASSRGNGGTNIPRFTIGSSGSAMRG